MNKTDQDAELAKITEAISRGGVVLTLCRHDSWCPKLKGGECKCNSEMVLATEKEFVDSVVMNRQQRRAAKK